ncbi:MAG: aldo/keto reductase, partial [Bacteroidota bacterium]
EHVAGRARSKTDVALRFVLQHAAVATAVVGIRTSAQLLDVVKATKAMLLSSDELFTLQQVLPINNYMEHR